MKVYIIYCVSTQIPYLEVFLFLRYRPKFSQQIKLQGFLINHIYFQNKSMKQPDFLLVDTDSKVIVDPNISGWTWSEIGEANLATGLKNDCISRMNGWSALIFCMLVQIQES